MVQDYVAGFLFSNDGRAVGLIEKDHPEWQAGRFNAIGGKVENNESYPIAMEREFLEETGVLIPHYKWSSFCQLTSNDPNNEFNVIFFKAFSDQVYKMKKTTSETPHILPVNYSNKHAIVPQVDWLIPMALDRDIINMVKVYV